MENPKFDDGLDSVTAPFGSDEFSEVPANDQQQQRRISEVVRVAARIEHQNGDAVQVSSGRRSTMLPPSSDVAVSVAESLHKDAAILQPLTLTGIFGGSTLPARSITQLIPKPAEGTPIGSSQESGVALSEKRKKFTPPKLPLTLVLHHLMSDVDIKLPDEFKDWQMRALAAIGYTLDVNGIPYPAPDNINATIFERRTEILEALRGKVSFGIFQMFEKYLNI